MSSDTSADNGMADLPLRQASTLAELDRQDRAIIHDIRGELGHSYRESKYDISELCSHGYVRNVGEVDVGETNQQGGSNPHQYELTDKGRSVLEESDNAAEYLSLRDRIDRLEERNHELRERIGRMEDRNYVRGEDIKPAIQEFGDRIKKLESTVE